MEPLLAKSNPPETLLEHTQNCLEVYSSIRDAMPYLSEISGEKDFFIQLFYSVALHDLGKAADGFQQQLKSNTKWNYRHEILSAGFVSGLKLTFDKKQAIGLTILTHHRDIETLIQSYPCYPKSNPGYQTYKNRIAELIPNWEQVIEIQEKIRLWSPKEADYRFETVHSIDQLTNAYGEFLIPYKSSKEEYNFTPLHKNYGMLIRGCMIACDHLASSGKNEIRLALRNIEESLLREIERKERLFKGWNGIQKASAEIEGNLMLSAPTGSGKTEAAMLWSGRNQENSLGNRVFYVLPYVASINAMYERLKNVVSDERIGLLHGKASYFIYQSLADKEYILSDKSIKASKTQNLTKKIYRPYKVLTPFQMLKAFFGIKGFETQFAEMSKGLFIFDEIHAYDPHTSALILEMIEILRSNYGAKFCIMTASMPKFLKLMLGEKLGNTAEYIEMTDNDRNAYTRHRIKLLDGEIKEQIPRIIDELKKGKQVLVICNTVRQAQTIFEELENIIPVAKLLHSRFILKDRENIEKEVSKANLLVATQVVEVSLDIDFDTMFSEPAPIDALVQRFGRVNRKRKKGICDVFICKQGGENDKFIYSAERVQKTLDVITGIGVLNESRIQTLIDTVYGEGYHSKEQEEFNDAQKSFKTYFSNLVPFIENDSGREEFVGLFKSIEVVPSEFESQFLEHIYRKEFYEAYGYIAQISERQFMRFYKGGLIYKINDKINQRFIRLKYDEKLGLLFDQSIDREYIY